MKLSAPNRRGRTGRVVRAPRGCVRCICRILLIPYDQIMNSVVRLRPSTTFVPRLHRNMTTTTLSDPSTLPLEPVASGSTPEALSVPNEIFLSLLHHPSFFEQASNTMLSLPPVLSFSYAAALPIGTFLVRISSTLPLMLWQRKRTRRFAEKVMPLIRRAQSVAALEVRAECRKEGKSYEEYQAAYKKRVSRGIDRVSSASNDWTPGDQRRCCPLQGKRRDPDVHPLRPTTPQYSNLHRHDPHHPRRLHKIPLRPLSLSPRRSLDPHQRRPHPRILHLHHPRIPPRSRRDALPLVSLARPPRSDTWTPPRSRSRLPPQRRVLCQDSTRECSSCGDGQ